MGRSTEAWRPRSSLRGFPGVEVGIDLLLQVGMLGGTFHKTPQPLRNVKVLGTMMHSALMFEGRNSSRRWSPKRTYEDGSSLNEFHGHQFQIEPRDLRNTWGFPKMGVPQNGWFMMENPIYKWISLQAGTLPSPKLARFAGNGMNRVKNRQKPVNRRSKPGSQNYTVQCTFSDQENSLSSING